MIARMTRARGRAALLALSLVALPSLVACTEDAPPAAAGPAVEMLTPTQHLVRASMALRGVRPSVDELRAVAADPDVLPEIVDYYLDSPEFGETIREMHAEQFLIDVDEELFPAGFPAVGALEGMDSSDINRSIVEAPTRLIEHVVMEDRPYHEIVTADYTLADPIVATVFGIPHEGDGWQVTHYDDGRPLAGILSDSFLFTRHTSTISNKNRGRAAFVARSLLCYDFLSREVEIDSGIDLSDEDAVAHAIRENPACVSCHQTLDPLAAHFVDYYPIYVPSVLESYPALTRSNPLRSLMYVTEPSYFGEPTSGVRDLGVLIAQDPRFSTCTARRFESYLAEIPLSEVPFDTVSRLNDVFLASGQNAKALARAIVLSDSFRTSHALEDEGADEVRGLLKARPHALARMIEDLTGYRWQTYLPLDFGTGQIGRIDLMTDSFFGFDVLAGGTDGQTVTQPSFTTSATSVLVLRALAAHAAPYAVNADFAEADPSRRWLLRSIEPDTTDEAAVRAQLAELVLRIYGEHAGPNDPSVDALHALFAETLADEGADAWRAWTVTLFAMLQDPRIAYY